MPWVNPPARATNQPIPLLRGWKREMRRSETVTAKVFPTQLKKETVTGSASDLE